MKIMTRKLTRSNDRVVAGVCSGIADYFGFDPALTRLGYLLLSILSAAFPGLLVYIILWIVMPKE
jgi:phage shock protein C